VSADVQRILSFQEAAVPPELQCQVAALEQQEWPPEPAIPPHGHDPRLSPVSMLLLDGGRVVASLAILSKEITHVGQRFQASGLSSVVTDHTHRNRGLGLRLVTAAREAIRASGADIGIFTCDGPLVPFYERAGWRALAGTVLVGGTPEAPLQSDVFAKVAMGSFFTELGRHHRVDFLGARVELYSGEIDRLW
jgi:aminoglycoside 2'-N-acetyltransferase I